MVSALDGRCIWRCVPGGGRLENPCKRFVAQPLGRGRLDHQRAAGISTLADAAGSLAEFERAVGIWNYQTGCYQRTRCFCRQKCRAVSDRVGADSIYVNGALACEPEDDLPCYGRYELNPAARAAIKPGRNVLAVHLIERHKGGEDYVDLGLLDETEPAIVSDPKL